VGGRPRKTQEELDAEMEDYFGGANAGEDVQVNEPAGGVAANAGGIGADATAGVSHQTDMDDVDMIE
jgi:THO complex subunit 4